MEYKMKLCFDISFSLVGQCVKDLDYFKYYLTLFLFFLSFFSFDNIVSSSLVKLFIIIVYELRPHQFIFEAHLKAYALCLTPIWPLPLTKFSKIVPTFFSQWVSKMTKLRTKNVSLSPYFWEKWLTISSVWLPIAEL
jgi:hypothetical protein